MIAKDWKHFYQAEREALGDRAIEKMIAEAEPLEILPESSLIFPHTRLSATGHMTALAARSIVESGQQRVLALGVLHGGREEDAALVAEAKADDPDALARCRRIHGPNAPSDRGLWTEEFSLDNFKYFVSVAARMFRKRPPEIIERYPFLTGTAPNSLPGMDELIELRNAGVPVVATADLVHHGIGYDTPRHSALREDDAATLVEAQRWIEEGMAALIAKDYDAFQTNAERVKSDFRHSGPVLRELLLNEAFDFDMLQLQLVDYTDVLRAPSPTWVAAAIVALS